MSTRFEGCDAATAGVTLDGPGSEIGEDRVPPGMYAISISYDEVFYIQGSPDALVTFAERVTREAAAAKADSQRKLVVADFAWDPEDHAYVCPRCEDGIIEAGEYDNAYQLMGAIQEHILAHDQGDIT